MNVWRSGSLSGLLGTHTGHRQPRHRLGCTSLSRGRLPFLRRARELDPAVVVMLDADGQHNPLEIPRVVQPILDGHADLVIGSRFLEGGTGVPRYRRLGQKTMDYAQNLG